MTDRERLTKHWGNNCVATKLNYDFLFSLPNIEVKNFNAIIQKLVNYEDLEEQGKIIVPPCKVGDTVYCIRTWPSGRKTIHPFEAPDWDWIMEHLNDFGKTIFTSRKEAEKVLEER